MIYDKRENGDNIASRRLHLEFFYREFVMLLLWVPINKYVHFIKSFNTLYSAFL